MRESFEIFRHVVFDMNGDYYVAVPLDAPPALEAAEREELRVEAQLLANLFASFEKEKIFKRTLLPTTGSIQKRLKRQGSKFANSEAFRVYEFTDGAWSDIILGAVMGAAKRAENDKRAFPVHTCARPRLIRTYRPSKARQWLRSQHHLIRRPHLWVDRPPAPAPLPSAAMTRRGRRWLQPLPPCRAPCRRSRWPPRPRCPGQAARDGATASLSHAFPSGRRTRNAGCRTCRPLWSLRHRLPSTGRSRD